MVWVGLSRKNAPANMARLRLLFQALNRLEALRMGKNILARETGEVEPDPIRQEAKAGLRQLFAAFAGEHDIEALFERMEMDDIGGRVGNLCFRALRAPGPSARVCRYRFAPAVRRSWCNKPARASGRKSCREQPDRNGRSERSSEAPCQPAAVSDWAHRRRAAGSARRRRSRRPATVAPRTTGRG